MEQGIFLFLGIVLGYMNTIFFYCLERERRIRAEKRSDDWMEWCFKLLDEANNQAQCDKIESNSNEQK